MGLRILGTGSYLPEKHIDNNYLAGIVDTNDEWITSRTGIKERRVSSGEGSVIMASNAAKEAIKSSLVDVLDIDMIIVATLSPDKCVPCTACEVQNLIGATNAVCFDLNSACTGFVFALNTVYTYMQSGLIKTALVIGVETLSKLLDWTDRATCVLFGDGAGAAIVKLEEKSMYKTIMGADGSKNEALTCATRRIKNPIYEDSKPMDYIKMNGQDVYKFVVKTIPTKINEILEKSNICKENIKYYILHQANSRMLATVAKHLNENIDKFPMNLDKYGNTSSATIPILLDEMNKKDMLKRGDKVILSGFGGGLTWGVTLMEW